MPITNFTKLKEQLLAQFRSDQLTKEEYFELLSELEHQEELATSQKNQQQQPSPFQSMGDFATNAQEAFRIEQGFKLGKFVMQRQLGRGGMGEVWRARDTVGEREVVIKILPPELSGNQNEIARIKESFKKIHTLNHENICPTYDLCEHPQIGFYLVMQYLEALTLGMFQRQQIEKESQLSFPLLCKILRKLAHGLDYAHSKKVIHRDIKPDNIMIADDGEEVWLIDFGLAEEIRSSMAKISKVQMDRSGTYPYMAPEQWKGALQDGTTDQYALAVVAYEMLAGRLPFDISDNYILRQAVLHEIAEPIEGQSDRVNQALFKALSKSREDRFASCLEFIAALSGEYSSESQTEDVIEPIQQTAVTSEVTQQFENSLGMWFSLIPPGTFMMGSPKTEKRRWETEEPHQVTITKPFYMATTVVTQGQWHKLMGKFKHEWFFGLSYEMEIGKNFPQNFITWSQAVEFCKKLSEQEGRQYRLPTEAEWEFACRGGSATAYYFGDNPRYLKEYAWCKNTWNIKAKEVAQKIPNQFGLFDMHGNVNEWCADYYDKNYYHFSPEIDPQGPESGSYRSIRGGAAGDQAHRCRSAMRSYWSPEERSFVGFRLLCELTEEQLQTFARQDEIVEATLIQAEGNHDR